MLAWTLLAGAALAAEVDEMPDEDVVEDMEPYRASRWERPQGPGLGISLLGETGLRFNVGLRNGGDLGVLATVGLSPWGGVVGGGALYDFPSKTRWQLQVRGGVAGVGVNGTLFAGVAAEYDPPSSFFLTIPANVYFARTATVVWIAPSLGWVVDFDGK